MKRTLYPFLFCAVGLAGLPAVAQPSPPAQYALHEPGDAPGPPQEERKSLASVLLELERRFNASIAYRSELVKDKVVDQQDRAFSSLEEALDVLLKGQNLKYKKIKAAVYVLSADERQLREVPKAKEKTFSTPSPESSLRPVTLPPISGNKVSVSPAATVAVSGTVTEERGGQGIPGVTVLLKGTTTGTTTNESGRYVLNAPGDDGILVFSSIGYVTREVPIGGRSTLDVALTADVKGLSEVIVVGYGTQRRSDLTGSVSSISEAEIKATPVTSLDQALQGRAAGVQVINSSGAPGGAVSVRVRGTGSINAGSEPLYVVDGFPLYNDNNETNPAGPGIPNGGAQNALASLNPNDIESIEVLKDASATAIYGARGANGVVLITTKRGKAGQSNIDLQVYYGVQQLRRTRPIFNPVEYAEYLVEKDVNASIAPAPNRGYNIDWNFLDSVRTAGTDWQEETFRPAPIQNYQLSFSGGTDKIRYAIGGNYFNQDGIIVNSKFNRYSLRVNLDADLNRWLKVGNNLSVSRTTNHGVVTENEGGAYGRGVVSGVFQTSPLDPVFVTEENNVKLYPTQAVGDYAGYNNPLGIARGRKNVTTNNRLIGDIYGDVRLLEGLSFRLKVGASVTDSRRNVFFPSTTGAGRDARGIASIGTNNSVNWLVENILSYNRTFGQRHALNAVAVYSLQRNYSESQYGESSNFVNDVLEEYSLGSGLTRTSRSGAYDYAFKSYTGRVNYIFDEKYLVTVTTRMDGSSRFGAGNKYAVFPSAAVAWRLSNEGFIQSLRLVSDLKVRASYGFTGNSEIGGYKSLDRFGQVNYVLNRQEVAGIAPTQVANRELQWERTRQLDVGVDLGLFGNRIVVVADYYHKVTDNLLLDIDLPNYTGFSRATVNVGALENRGVELAVNSQNLTGALTWNTSLNVARNRNKVTKLYNANQLVTGFLGGDVIKSNGGNVGIIKVGYPLGAYFGAIYEGVWRDQPQIEEVGTMPDAKPGTERFRDTNGDGQVDSNDFTIIGNGQPDVVLGVTNTFAYKGFSLSVFMNGMLGYDVFNHAKARSESTNGGENKFKSLLDRWTIDNPDARYPAAGIQPFDGASTRYIERGDYLRVKNITLGYQLPAGLVKGVRNARLYLSGDNLFTFTEYSGFDPEVNSAGVSNTIMGLDMNAYPSVKMYRIGLDLGF